MDCGINGRLPRRFVLPPNLQILDMRNNNMTGGWHAGVCAEKETGFVAGWVPAFDVRSCNVTCGVVRVGGM